jgi:hypothetical protein
MRHLSSHYLKLSIFYVPAEPIEAVTSAALDFNLKAMLKKIDSCAVRFKDEISRGVNECCRTLSKSNKDNLFEVIEGLE